MRLLILLALFLTACGEGGLQWGRDQTPQVPACNAQWGQVGDNVWRLETREVGCWGYSGANILYCRWR